ncbi:MAG: tRNA (adenosine(37)-N6)-threonylcarbamoyltransferase complex dimerization subunit type 1 TsaB [Acidobacteria bacterium]|nr:tRNA (adenosine(37)-N6)-threonylcarbamoyltransferase complex dimerization subunit type 1 TsaB [Acidobacteriota bacterium]
MSVARQTPRLFAIDSGSPVSSVALAWDGDLLTREFAVGESSKRLLPLLDEMLAEASGRLQQLQGLVGLRGPGSFTGLRVGLATLLGLHQSLKLRAGTATTFEALARQAQRRSGATQGRIFAAIDALRGERFIQGFDAATLQPLGEPEIRSDDDIAHLGPGSVIGFGLQPLRASIERDGGSGILPDALVLCDAEPLAADLAAIAAEPGFAWDASELTRPLYLRPPAAALARVRA